MPKSILWAVALGLTLAACKGDDTRPVPPEGLGTVSESALQDHLRHLWTERVFWERALIISTMHALGDRDVVSERVRRNSTDLAAAFDVFYSSVGAGMEIVTFLDAEQDLIEAALNTAVAGGDLGDTQGPWKDNMKAFGDYLESLNSKLPGGVDNALDDSVDHAFNQIQQRLISDWIDDVNAFDRSVKNARELADDLARGFLKQYPDHVTEESNDEFQELRSKQREVWMEHGMWLHFLNVSGLNDLPDLPATQQRVFTSTHDLGDSLRRLYGGQQGQQFSDLLVEHARNASLVIRLTRGGAPGSIVPAKVQGYAFADQLAQFLSALNPNLPLEVTRPNMKQHQDLEYEDLDALFAGDFARDVDAVDELMMHLVMTADAFSTATQALFPYEVNR